MSCFKVKFESYLLLLLSGYDRNWPVTLRYVLWGWFVIEKKCSNGVRDISSRRHSLLHHTRTMFTRDIELPKKSGGPIFDCLPHIKELVENCKTLNKPKKLPKTATFYARLNFKCESAGHNFANSHFFRV